MTYQTLKGWWRVMSTENITRLIEAIERIWDGNVNSRNLKFYAKNAREDLVQIETELNRLRAEVDKYKSKEDDYNSLLKSEGEQLIFKISANVDEIANMISVEGGGEYNIFVPDAFKITTSDQEQLSSLSEDILSVLMTSLNRRWNKEMSEATSE